MRDKNEQPAKPAGRRKEAPFLMEDHPDERTGRKSVLAVGGRRSAVNF
jgi:hypothetical protein